jgi:tRNA pseudouridine55 synthase
MTSHDVVAAVRRATGEGRVGHTGTLDPMATGLLVVLIGAYTRLAPYLTSVTKTYEATISFGSETDTDDAEGAIVRTSAVPSEVLDPDYAISVLAGFCGVSSQVPPAYSAIKVGGRTAYHAARAGAPLELEPREIDVLRAELASVDPGTDSWTVAFDVSKGTYVRALARDIGRACGTAAHLSDLRRVSSGALTLSDAHSLDAVASAAEASTLSALFVDPLNALGLPVMPSANPATFTGATLEAPDGDTLTEGQPVAVTFDGVLAGVYRSVAGRLVPAVVLPGGTAQ